MAIIEDRVDHDAEFARALTTIERIVANVERVIVGKRPAIRRILASLICRGHVLVEDVPGVGKTTLVRSLARSLGCDFCRIQFTPDLLPSDITGVSILDPTNREFRFQPGPIFSQVVLADEINRTSPKTQSSLLECMEEGQVTIDGTTHRLPEPFLVLATQNPIEYEGTFPLPEAQVDRFLVRISIGYPLPSEEKLILDAQSHGHPLTDLGPVVGPGDILWLQRLVTDVRVAEPIKDYIVAIVAATRRHDDVYLGASPRGSLSLFRLSRAAALLSGRDYVSPDDVKETASSALAHRILLKPESGLHGRTTQDVVEAVLARTAVPVAAGHG